MRWEPIYCDSCGDMLQDHEQHHITKLPININNAKAGESAVLCRHCFQGVMAHAERSSRA